MTPADIAIYLGLLITLITSAAGFRRTFSKVGDVHVLVNSQLTRTQERVEQLSEAMHEAHVPVPAAPNYGIQVAPPEPVTLSAVVPEVEAAAKDFPSLVAKLAALLEEFKP